MIIATAVYIDCTLKFVQCVVFDVSLNFICSHFYYKLNQNIVLLFCSSISVLSDWLPFLVLVWESLDIQRLRNETNNHAYGYVENCILFFWEKKKLLNIGTFDKEGIHNVSISKLINN